jgi:hypothetical protein
MELLAKIKIDNLFRDKEFTDAKSGETKTQKWKIQEIESVVTENGTKTKLNTISITEEFYEKIKDKLGHVVSVSVKPWNANGKSGFYGV